MDNNQKVYECDLHCHTDRSDGNASLKEVIDLASERGVKVLAITDHDVRPADFVEDGNQEIGVREYGKRKNVFVIPGIEISCDTQVEDVHIVGLGCDWNAPFFSELEKQTIKSKVNSYRELVRQLNQSGIQIDWDELLYSEGQPLQPEMLQKKKIFEMIARKGYVPTWQDAKLMVKRSKKYNVMREKPDPFYVIHNIHKTGGVAILAHPYLFSVPIIREGKVLERSDYIEDLIEQGLDGIEASYTYDKTSYEGSRSKRELEDEIRKKYEGKVHFVSGGSDYHADERKGVKNPRMLGECGVSLDYFNEHIIPFLPEL